MKKILIITGIVIGVLASLIEPIVSHADTATLENEFGFDIPNLSVFIVQTLIFATAGALIGLLIFFLTRKFCNKNNHYDIKP